MRKRMSSSGGNSPPCVAITQRSKSAELISELPQRILLSNGGQQFVFQPIALPVGRQLAFEHFQVQRHDGHFDRLLVDIDAVDAAGQQARP